jgi:hypothetical protein
MTKRGNTTTMIVMWRQATTDAAMDIDLQRNEQARVGAAGAKNSPRRNVPCSRSRKKARFHSVLIGTAGSVMQENTTSL